LISKQFIDSAHLVAEGLAVVKKDVYSGAYFLLTATWMASQKVEASGKGCCI
jgi:hypothetical protein